MYPACAKFGMGGTPVAMGFLTTSWRVFSNTKHGEGQGQGFLGQEFTEMDVKINEQIEKLAKQHGVSMATVAIAWSLCKPFITAPILGMSKKEREDGAVAAVSFTLSPGELKSIDDLYQPKKMIGHQ